MQKIVSGIYQISPVEGFQVLVSGPLDPVASLDGNTLTLKRDTLSRVTPDVLNGMGASHFLFINLIFVGDDPGQYKIDILDDGGQLIDRIPVDGPDNKGGESAQVQISIQVEAAAAMAAMAHALTGKRKNARRKKP